MSDHNPILKHFSLRNIMIPIVIGLCVIAYMISKNYKPESIELLTFTGRTYFWLFVAFLFMVFRDFGYVVRLRILTDKSLNWRQSLKIIMLWEFTSAVTPGAVGGAPVAIFYLNKEGLGVGKSTATVLLTSFLDELFFILMFPVLLIFFTKSELFGSVGDSSVVEDTLFTFCLLGYLVKLGYLSLSSYGLFINPRGFKWLIVKFFSIKFLRRWKPGALTTGDDIIATSKELKNKSISFWVRAFLATFLSWSSRYLVANALLLAFFTVSDHFLFFAKQFVLWIGMLVSPTPGGSGLTEYGFTHVFKEFIPVESSSQAAVTIAIAFMWRLITYYPYLLIGVILLPRWISKKFK